MQVPLKAAQDLCDDVVEISGDLNGSGDSSEYQSLETEDTWKWSSLCHLSVEVKCDLVKQPKEQNI